MHKEQLWEKIEGRACSKLFSSYRQTKPFVWNDRDFMWKYCAVVVHSKLYPAILIEVLNNLKGAVQTYCLGE